MTSYSLHAQNQLLKSFIFCGSNWFERNLQHYVKHDSENNELVPECVPVNNGLSKNMLRAPVSFHQNPKAINGTYVD